MDDIIIPQTSPPKNNNKRVWWAIGIVGGLAYLALLFWLLFYSVYAANIPFIIPLRNWYQDTYWKVERLVLKPVRTYPPFDPIYAIQVKNILPKIGYTYRLIGIFFGINSYDKTLDIKSFNNHHYYFDINESLRFTYSDIKPEDYIYGLSKLLGKSIIEVEWNDQRSLYQIEKDYYKNSAAFLN